MGKEISTNTLIRSSKEGSIAMQGIKQTHSKIFSCWTISLLKKSIYRLENQNWRLSGWQQIQISTPLCEWRKIS
jgi:hypothetical protein